MITLPDENIKCRYTNFKKKCRDLCQNCPAWIHIQGTNPQTGVPEDYWNCADALVPILLMDNTQKQIETGAAIESFRNEVVKQNDLIIAAAAGIPLKIKEVN